MLVGRPNAGKSSLLNALVGYDRAIVTDVPGTTRDTVEARCRLGGVVLKLIDTAGLRDTEDEVERIGVARSRAALEEARLALLVVDGSEPLTAEDLAAMDEAEKAPRVLCLVNKSDRPLAADVDALRRRFPNLRVVSAATGAGLDSPPAGRRRPGSCSPTPARPRPPAGPWRGWSGPGRAWRRGSPPTPCSPMWRRPCPPWGSSPGPACGRM